jgi:hypothetical protein
MIILSTYGENTGDYANSKQRNAIFYILQRQKDHLKNLNVLKGAR